MVLCCLQEAEDAETEKAENEWYQDLSGFPRVFGTAPGKCKEDRDHGGDEKEVADEVNAFETVLESGFCHFYMQENEEKTERQGGDGEIEVETPTPSNRKEC